MTEDDATQHSKVSLLVIADGIAIPYVKEERVDDDPTDAKRWRAFRRTTAWFMPKGTWSGINFPIGNDLDAAVDRDIANWEHSNCYGNFTERDTSIFICENPDHSHPENAHLIQLWGPPTPFSGEKKERPRTRLLNWLYGYCGLAGKP